MELPNSLRTSAACLAGAMAITRSPNSRVRNGWGKIMASPRRMKAICSGKSFARFSSPKGTPTISASDTNTSVPSKSLRSFIKRPGSKWPSAVRAASTPATVPDTISASPTPSTRPGSGKRFWWPWRTPITCTPAKGPSASSDRAAPANVAASMVISETTMGAGGGVSTGFKMRPARYRPSMGPTTPNGYATA
ncbi:hypothetical protein D3C72_1566530 [compost metagenome]